MSDHQNADSFANGGDASPVMTVTNNIPNFDNSIIVNPVQTNENISKQSLDGVFAASAEHEHIALSHHNEYLTRRYRRRYENGDRIRELIAEEKQVLDNLKTAIDSKMDVAVVGILNNMLTTFDAFQVPGEDLNSESAGTSPNSSDMGDRQRALFRCGICPLLAQCLRDLGGHPVVCERTLHLIAYLCRYSEENKHSICLENCKGFGLSMVCDFIVGACKRHNEEKRVLEAACDAIRSMCALDSNQERFGVAGACEVMARALTKYHSHSDLTIWLCRVMGHLARIYIANRDILGSNGACQIVVMALQKFPNNVNVCTEACWAIRNMAPSDQNRVHFATDFAPESIVAVFKSHYSNEAFAIEACRALINLVASEQDPLIERVGVTGTVHTTICVSLEHCGWLRFCFSLASSF
jgi:hypothetical protein